MRSVLPALFFWILSGPAAAQERQLTIESFDGRVEIGADGIIDVEERLRVRFDGEWNGVRRVLSLKHRTARDRRETLRLEDIAAVDGDGQPLRIESERESGARRLLIWVPGAVDATRTVVLRYRVTNALRFFDEDAPTGYHDELYWNVTGNEWDVAIRRATATIVLPNGVSELAAWAYTGPAGSVAQDAAVQVDATTVRVAANRPFDAYEGLTVSVTWAPGVVQRPSAADLRNAAARYWWPAALPFLALLFMGRTWSRVGRDPKPRAIVVQYEPPSDLTPAELGTLVDHEAEMRDITATLVDLAVRGFVQIEEREEKRFLGLSTTTEYHFHLLRPRQDWRQLLDHEQRYLEALFFDAKRKSKKELDQPPAGTHATVRLKQLKNEFYRHLEKIRDAIYDRLVTGGHYERRPDKVKGRWMLAGGLILMLAIAGAAWVSEDGPPLAGAWPLGVGGGLAGVVVLFFAQILPARTIQGTRTREAALGFREFLERVESPRYRAMITSPDLFEKYLPFAMAFGVEERWADAFADILTTPPDWYRGSGSGFDASSFGRSMSSLGSEASSTMASSPSGSGGGGSSGGGSGGGGGGGF